MSKGLQPPVDAAPQDESGVSSGTPSRRSFLKFGISGIAAVTVSTWIPEGVIAAQAAPQWIDDVAALKAGERRIRLTVNGQLHKLNVPTNAILLSMCSVTDCSSLAPRKDATMVNAAPALCW